MFYRLLVKSVLPRTYPDQVRASVEARPNPQVGLTVPGQPIESLNTHTSEPR